MAISKINSLNNLFTRNSLRHLIEFNKDDAYTSVIRRYISNPEGKLNEELISEVYLELKKGYRNEYFYKNTLLNKLLLGIHSINTTTALTEIPIAKSKADFLLINGKAVVYEIKTELDNFDRLESQINDYYKAFDHVAVVTCKENLNALMKKVDIINKPIGIYILQRKGVLTEVQKPQRYNECLDLEILFKTMRKAEYEEIILNKFGELPDVSQFKYYTECKKLFLNMPVEEAYIYTLQQLKKRAKIIKEEFYKVPYELKFLTYFMNFKKQEYKKLEVFLKKEYMEG